jgi:signal transduction histidine kinase
VVSTDKLGLSSALTEITRIGPRGESLDALLNRSLRALTANGFDRSRMYFRVPDPLRNRNFFIMAASNPSLGFGVSFEADALTLGLKKKTELRATVFDRNDLPTEQLKMEWFKILSLSDKWWVDVPVGADADIGLLVVDCPDTQPKPTLEDLQILDGIAFVLGKQIAALSTEREMTQVDTNFDGALRALLDETVHELGAAIGSMFEYNVSSDSIRKTFEIPNRGLKANYPPIEEEYRVGQFLTGMAWTDPRLRHILDLEVSSEVSELNIKAADVLEKYVAPKSLARHKGLFGSVNTLLYGVVPTFPVRYMIRLINKLGNTLPFTLESKQLEVTLRQKAVGLQNLQNDRRLEMIGNVVNFGASMSDRGERQLSEYTNELNRVLSTALLGFGFQDYALVSHFSSRPMSTLTSRSLTGVSGSDDLIHSIKKEDGIAVSSLAGRSGTFVERLQKLNFKSLITVRVSGEEYSLVLVLPSVCDDQVRLATYSDRSYGVIAQAMAAGVAHIEGIKNAEAALTALGMVGHEIETPLSILMSHIWYSTEVAKETIRSVKQHYPHAWMRTVTLDHNLEIAEARLRNLEASMKLARLISFEGKEQRMDVTFEWTNLFVVCDRALEQVSKENRERRFPHRSRFVGLEKVHQLGSISADSALIEIALVNLLRNAAKYSVAIQGEAEVRIDCRRDGNRRFLLISNLGVTIPKDQQARIFDAFVRGDTMDRRFARKGMGLGLYLARRIARVHSGELRLTQHTPAQGSQWFNTTFEIELSGSLQEGVATATFASADSPGSRSKGFPKVKMVDEP